MSGSVATKLIEVLVMARLEMTGTSFTAFTVIATEFGVGENTVSSDDPN